MFLIVIEIHRRSAPASLRTCETMSEAMNGVTVYDDPEQLADATAELILVQLRARRGRLLLARGTAARRAYQLVAQLATPADYKGAHLFFADERMVPVAHAESNYGMVKRAWLEPARFPPERVHRIRGEIEAERAARLAEEDLRAVTGEPPQLDLALLALGGDGHVASLYPASEALDDTDRLYVPARNATRVTATLTLLAGCKLVVFLVSGADRAEALRSAICDPPGAVPASLVGSVERPPLWLVDRAAASLLP
jgi:6-phosphogluconolactonase